MLHIIFEVAFEDTATFEDDLAFALFFAINPISFISSLVDCILPEPMAESIFDLSFVGATIWPFVATLSCDAIILKLASIHNTVGPSKSALPAQKSIIKIAFIGVTIFEGDFCWAIQAFPIDFAVLR